MNILLVEDEASCLHILKSYLEPYGEYDIAEDGKKAIELIKNAIKNNSNYDLICLDINLPELNGMDVLKKLRQLEEDHGINIGEGSKVIMTTGLDHHKKIMEAFNEQCEVYLVKPIEKQKLVESMKSLKLIK